MGVLSRCANAHLPYPWDKNHSGAKGFSSCWRVPADKTVDEIADCFCPAERDMCKRGYREGEGLRLLTLHVIRYTVSEGSVPAPEGTPEFSNQSVRVNSAPASLPDFLDKLSVGGCGASTEDTRELRHKIKVVNIARPQFTLWL